MSFFNHILVLIPVRYRFVDHNMFMRFRGGGIGHKVTRDWDDILQREGHGAEEAGQEVVDTRDEGSEAEEEDEEWDDDMAVDDNNNSGSDDEDDGSDDDNNGDKDEEMIELLLMKGKCLMTTCLQEKDMLHCKYLLEL